MKVSTVSATFALAMTTSVYAAPTAVGTQDSSLSKREQDQINDLIATLNSYSVKRSLITDPVEIQAREYAIVTQILAAIDSTDLAPQIIQGLVDNPNLQPYVTKATIAIIKSGLISLDTLFTALNDSGLAVKVIDDLIHDCTLYQDIYKLALEKISDLTSKILSKLAGNNVSVREFPEGALEEMIVAPSKRYNPDGVVNNLLESLANSGLATSVVRVLLVDPKFLSYGASLFKQLYDQDLINWSGLISAIADSGLVTSLFDAFFNVATLKTVIFNALAAAFDNCGGSTISGTPTGLTTQSTSTTSIGSFTATGTSVPSGSCKKRRRKRSYNY
ncbi:CIC11C00000001104 [Sungouiella intermedia]|uniref:CIC11C00000001104 n=1 Tax=Sungouiella intermedia TaxID=45354 RepID=A0A1L0BR18_9ASCO|nr:CIC11C00000001104 [[Candida] intermedia]